MEHGVSSTTDPAYPASTAASKGQGKASEDRTVGPRPGPIPVPRANLWTLHVCPTTGGQFSMRVTPQDCIEGLKRAIAKRLKIPKERLILLHRDRLLKEGSLRDNGVTDSSKITLLPNVESGLMSQRPDHSVMQALENLSDNQVNEFLGGRSPLTLAMRLGDHMVFVQLQLSTSPPNSKRPSTSSGSPSFTTSLPKRPKTGTSVPLVTKPVPVLPVASIPTPAPVPLSQIPMDIASSSSVANNTNTGNVSSTKTASKDSSKEGYKPAAPVPILDSAALEEASRNLQQKLKELSRVSPSPSSSPVKEMPAAEVTPSVTPSTSSSSSSSASSASSTPSSSSSSSSSSSLRSSSGAIIESMQHHGQGVYSGTFSGTLNPALQDRDGKPKRSISTIVHILNDLLGASPQYRAHMHHHHHHHHRLHHHHHPRHHHHRHHHHHARPQGLERPARTWSPTSPTSSTGRISPHNFSFGERLQENRATRGKMEHLQMMLEERRLRRQARREARSSPYPSWGAGRAQRDGSSADSQCPMEVDANVASNVADQLNDSKYNELKQETVFV